MYAEEKLKAEIAKEIIEKVVKPARRRELAHKVRADYSVISVLCVRWIAMKSRIHLTMSSIMPDAKPKTDPFLC